MGYPQTGLVGVAIYYDVGMYVYFILFSSSQVFRNWFLILVQRIMKHTHTHTHTHKVR